MRKRSIGLVTAFAALVAIAALCLPAYGQAPPPPPAGGVYIDANGVVCFREADEKKELDSIRNRARNAKAVKDDQLCFVSLPRLLAQVHDLARAAKPIPEELRCLGGMTQLRYVIVDPQAKDLIIAGPYEPIERHNAIEVVGQRTGRPVMQLDDLVVCLRMAYQKRHNEAFGCSIDPSPDSLEKSTQVMRDYANATRQERMDAMAKALGPQQVRVFGAVNDTRLAFVCIAADYRLKRISLGIDQSPVNGVGNAIDASRAAASRIWFEACYDPLLVSADANVYELRGPRLQLKAGAVSFDPKGATHAAETFAKQFTQKISALAGVVPIFADLQNIADFSVLATLIRTDQLDAKSGLDLKWLLDANGYAAATVPVAHTTQTLVAYTSGSICAGGVSLNVAPWIAPSARQRDDKDQLAPVRQQRQKISGDSPIWTTP